MFALRAFDAIGQDLLPGDIVACTEGGGNYGASINVGMVEDIFQGKGSHSKIVKARIQYHELKNNYDGTKTLRSFKKAVDPKVKCIKMEGFNYHAYVAELQHDGRY